MGPLNPYRRGFRETSLSRPENTAPPDGVLKYTMSARISVETS